MPAWIEGGGGRVLTPPPLFASAISARPQPPRSRLLRAGGACSDEAVPFSLDRILAAACERKTLLIEDSRTYFNTCVVRSTVTGSKGLVC
jgi:hypothetical protein